LRQNDAKKIASARLKDNALALLEVIRSNPYENPPPYNQPGGDLAGAYSRRINIQHRIGQRVLERERTAKIQRTWTHYE
jgi:Txe/YoeB family toxin of toxin-antitoxin system